MRTKPDITMVSSGSIFLLAAETALGLRWLTKNLDPTWSPWFPVEHRFVDDIVQGARAAGLRIGEARNG